jgi:hypothetical protein
MSSQGANPSQSMHDSPSRSFLTSLSFLQNSAFAHAKLLLALPSCLPQVDCSHREWLSLIKEGKLQVYSLSG